MCLLQFLCEWLDWWLHTAEFERQIIPSNWSNHPEASSPNTRASPQNLRDLRVHIDDELTMKQHVGKVAGSCFYHLRWQRRIWLHVSNGLMAQLIYAFVTSRLDYCNSVLACLPACTIAPSQRVQNAAARLLLNRRNTDHITDGLKDWLLITFRIQYKLCRLMHLIMVGNCPSYLKDMVSLSSSVRTRSGLRSTDTDAFTYDNPRTRTKLGERAFSSAGPTAWNKLP